MTFLDPKQKNAFSNGLFKKDKKRTRKDKKRTRKDKKRTIKDEKRTSPKKDKKTIKDKKHQGYPLGVLYPLGIF